MKETEFIAKNHRKWEEYEALLANKKKDPEKLKELYLELTDDLSYSRTFYNNRAIRVYLNGIAQKIFQSLYRSQKYNWNYFVAFWKEELPMVMYHARFKMLLSLVVFLITFGIGYVSNQNDAELANLVLGEEYMRMTEENIASGDPMAVYKKMNGVQMFLGITVNNIRVSFLTFVLGALYMIGAIIVLANNGLMLGVFQNFFIERGFATDSLLTIWQHGTLEISAIIIAGGAGLTLGHGLVFPGTYKRITALRISAVRGIKIMLGIFPIFIVAGFIEGFITRLTDAPVFFRLLVIGASLAFVILYFGVFPFLVAKRKSRNKSENMYDGIKPPLVQELPFHEIRSVSQIFTDVLFFIQRYLGFFIRIAFGLSLLYTISMVVFIDVDQFLETFSYTFRFSKALNNVLVFFFYERHPELIFFNTALFLIPSMFVGFYLKQQSESPMEVVRLKNSGFSKNSVRFVLRLIAMYMGIAALIYLRHFFTLTAALVLYPFLTIWVVSPWLAKDNSRVRFFSLISKNTAYIVGAYLVFVIFGIILFFGLMSPLLFLYLEFLQWHILPAYTDVTSLNVYLTSFIMSFIFNIIMLFLFAGCSYAYFSLYEKNVAADLKSRIQTLFSTS